MNTTTMDNLRMLPLTAIAIDPEQNARLKRAENGEYEGLETLAASIKAHGLLQPVIVADTGDGFELIAGFRRYAAVEKLGWKEIPCRVVEAKQPGDIELLNLVENVQRYQLTPYEVAKGIERVKEANPKLTHELIGKRLDMSAATVGNYLRLLEKLSPSAIEIWEDDMVPLAELLRIATLEHSVQDARIAAYLEGQEMPKGKGKTNDGSERKRSAKPTKKDISNVLAVASMKLDSDTSAVVIATIQWMLGTSPKLKITGKQIFPITKADEKMLEEAEAEETDDSGDE